MNAFLTERNTTLGATGAARTVASTGNGTSLTATAHGLAVGSGPYVLTTTGVLPTGLALSTLYWVFSVVDANTITLTTRRGAAPVTSFTHGTGSGTHTLTKAGTRRAFFELLRQAHPRRIRASADVDNL